MKKYCNTLLFGVCFLILSLSVFPLDLRANAKAVNYKCSTLSRMIEIEEGLPPLLLSAITFIESSDMPWVIGVKGVSYRFYTKEAAIKKTQELLSQGVTNLDVGCMQVNHYFHNKKFKSLDDMFHPVHNIRYAARLIKSLHDETNSWEKAIAYYNSRDLRYSHKYREKVTAEWDKQKLRSVPSGESLYFFANFRKEKLHVQKYHAQKKDQLLGQNTLSKAQIAYIAYKKALIQK